jgi:hypothetical protein
VVAAVLTVYGVVFADDSSAPSAANDRSAVVSGVAMQPGGDAVLDSSGQVLGTWTSVNAHGVYEFTFEPDGTWTVSRGDQAPPFIGGDYTVEEKSRLRMTIPRSNNACGGTTASYRMTVLDHWTLSGEVIQDDCYACYFRGTHLVLERTLNTFR